MVQTCGSTFEETVIEYSPGAAQALAESAREGHNIDIERLAGAEVNSISLSSTTPEAQSPSSSSLRHCDKKCRSTNEAEDMGVKVDVS